MRLVFKLAIITIPSAVALAQGQESFERLRQWVAASPISQQRPHDELGRSAKRMRQSVDLIGAILEQAARRAESGQRPVEELEALARVRLEFERSQSELGSRLPDASWRGHYRTRVAGLTRLLDSASQPGRVTAPQLRDASRTFSQAFQDEPEARPRSQIVTASEEAPPFRMAPDSAPTLPVKAARIAPRPAELDADAVVLLTPEIRSRAAALGNDPVRIFAFVHDNVEPEWYAGALQNSQAVLWSRRAASTDQATLLIALLRAAGIPSRYVFGSISVPHAEFADWVGAKNPAAAIYTVSRVIAIQFSATESSIDHMWVEAFINGEWVTLDPSFKTRHYQPGLKIPTIAFQREAYLNSVKSYNASDAYLDQIREYLRQNHPGRALSELAYTGPIQPAAPDRLPAAPGYTVTRVLRRVASIEKQDAHRIVITLRSAGGATTYFTKELLLPETSLKNLSIASDAPGGAPSPSNGTGTFRPTLNADDDVIATGSAALPANTPLELRVQYYFPYFDTPQEFTRSIPPGQLIAIPVHAYHGMQYLNYRIDRLLALNPATVDTGRALREILHIAGVRWFQQWNEMRDAMSKPLQLRSVYIRAHFGYTFASGGAERLFDRPLVVTAPQFSMDMSGTVGAEVDLNVGALSTSYRDWNRTIGLSGSFMEHRVWEDIALKHGVSTTKVFQWAGEDRVPMVTITRANSAAELAPLPYTAAQKSEITGRFSNPLITLVELPARIVSREGLRFFVYTSENAIGGGTFIIQGAAGGSTLNQDGKPPAAGPTGDPDKSGGTTVGDPVSVSNGNMIHQVTDLSLAARGFPVVLERSYNSQSTTIGPFGLGWTHSHNLSLRLGEAAVDFFNGTGGTYTLVRQGDQFVSSLLLGLRLRQDGSDYVLRNRGGFQWRFDNQGKLRQLIDRNGNSQTLGYNPAGHLVSIADPAGRQVTFSYDVRNRITTVQDFTGRRLTYGYDAGDRLTESVDFAGSRTTYSYYSGALAAQNLRSITDPEGNTTTWVYYGDDKVFKTISPAGGEQVFFYLPIRRMTVTVDERGFSTSYEYDAAGRTTQVVDPDGNSITSRFDANGLLVQTGDQAGNTFRFDYDAAGNVVRAVDPLGNANLYTFEPVFNRITSVTDRRGNVTRAAHDQRGNVTRSVGPTGAATTFSYDQSGNLTGVTDADGKTTTLANDSNGLLTQATDSLGATSRVERDPLGRPTRILNPLGDSSTFDYDALNRVVRSASRLGHQIAFTYDRIGRLTQSTDANGNTSRFAFDGLSNLTGATLPTGESTLYGYQPADCYCPASTPLLSTVRNAKGASSTLSYNHRGQPLERRNAVGEVTRYTYDARGNLIEVVHADGAVTGMAYDLNNRMVERVRSDGVREAFTYDAGGNLTVASNPSVTYNFTYDQRNFITSVRDSRFPEPILFEFDRLGRVARMTDPQGGVTEYTYDERDLVSTIRNPTGLTTTFLYDAANRRREVAFANGARADYRWDADDRLLSITYRAGDAILNQFSYEYDRAGNRLAMTDLAGRHEYSYDAAYRITAATHPDQPPEQYAYDASGNRTSSHREQSLTYDADDRLISSGGALTYDRRGSLVSRGSQKFAYDNLGRLVRVESEGGAVTYSYDPFGRRIEKNVNGAVTKYLYSGTDILQEYDGDNRLVARYSYGPLVDEPLIMERDANSNGSFESTEALFYLRDGLGSIRALAGAAGNLIEQYRYDSFGAPIAEPAKSVPHNPFRFTAREWDDESGLYFYRARHYDAALGRFLQRDIIWDPFRPETLNRYAYVHNNPVNLVDPTGLTPISNADLLESKLSAIKGTTTDLLIRTLITSNMEPGSGDAMETITRFKSLDASTLSSDERQALDAGLRVFQDRLQLNMDEANQARDRNKNKFFNMDSHDVSWGNELHIGNLMKTLTEALIVQQSLKKQ